MFFIVSLFSSFVFRSNVKPMYFAQFFQETLLTVLKYFRKYWDKHKNNNKVYKITCTYECFFFFRHIYFYLLTYIQRTKVCSFYKSKIVSTVGVQSCNNKWVTELGMKQKRTKSLRIKWVVQCQDQMWVFMFYCHETAQVYYD